MSRHEIPAKNPDDTVFVGWDHPLLTFFGQVYRQGVREDRNPVFWVGASRLRELYEVDDLVRAMRPYAELSGDIQATLYGDKDEGR